MCKNPTLFELGFIKPAHGAFPVAISITVHPTLQISQNLL